MKKCLQPDAAATLLALPDVGSTHSALHLDMMARDTDHIWLFGIPANRNSEWTDSFNHVVWRVLLLVPGCQPTGDGFVYGPLEGRVYHKPA